MKRWVFLALLALLCVLVPACLAEEEPQVFTSGDYWYILLPGGGAEITRYTGYAADLTVPAQLDGYAVRRIGDEAFYWRSSLASITLPEGLESIGDEAFSWCSSLASVTLPEGLESIGDNAFSDCSSLASVTLPEGLQSIEDGAFNGCDNLELTVVRDSYAHRWAEEHSIPYVFPAL